MKHIIVERVQDKKALEPVYPEAKFWVCSSGAHLLAKAIISIRHEPIVLVLPRNRDDAAARAVLSAVGTDGTHWEIRRTA